MRWASTGSRSWAIPVAVRDALACGALLPKRVLGVVSLAGLAPFCAAGLDWFAGMADSGVATLRAAAEGREAKERYVEEFGEDYDPEFTSACTAPGFLDMRGGYQDSAPTLDRRF
jgi:hypothetical protein